MTAKITLYSEDKLIKGMKAFAKKQNTSVSKIVNSFFESVLLENQDTQTESSKITDKLFGLLKDENFRESDYKQHLKDKYL